MSSISNKFKQTWHNEDYYQTLFFLLVVAAIIIFAGIGLRDPWPADEPRFVEVAREMVQSGNWFFQCAVVNFTQTNPRLHVVNGFLLLAYR